MLRKRLGEDKDVVEIDKHEFVPDFPQNVGDQSLEYSCHIMPKGITKYSKWLEMGIEGGLPFIPCPYVHRMVSIPQIQLSETLCPLEWLKSRSDEWKGRGSPGGHGNQTAP